MVRNTLVLLFALCLLAGCRAGAARATQTQPSAPPSPTATVTTEVPAAAPTGTAAPTPTVADTSSPTLLPTGSPEELPLPPRIDLPGDAGGYTLSQPDPQALLDMIDIVRRRKGLVNGYSGDYQWTQAEADRWDWLSRGVMYENAAVLDAIDNAFLRAYPAALPDPKIALSDQLMRRWTNSSGPFVAPYPPRYLVDVMLKKLNQSGKTLAAETALDFSQFMPAADEEDALWQPSFVISASPAELDGKADREWILYLRTPYTDIRYAGLQLWQAVDELPGPQYLALGEPVIAEPFFYAETFAALDLTGDARTDLITSGTGTGFGIQRTNFTVYQWMGNAFQQRSYLSEWVDMGMIMEDENGPRYQVVAGSGLPALRLVEDINKPWGCAYQKIKIYRWPGGREQRQETDTAGPHSPGCLLADAKNVQEPAAAILAYQRALAGFNAQDPIHWPMVSYAHYRLAMLYALQGNDTAARQHLQPLLDGFPDQPQTAQYLREQLTPLLEQARVPVIRLCSLGFQAGVQEKGALGDWFKGLYYPFDYGGPFPEDVCHPLTITLDLLQTAPTSDEAALRAYLQAGGAEVQYLQPFHVPGEHGSGWLLQVEVGHYAPAAYVYLPGAAGGKWQQYSSFLSDGKAQTALIRDATGGGADEIASAVLADEPGACEGQRRYYVRLTGRFDPGLPHYLNTEFTHCQPAGEPLDLAAFLADADGDGIADRLAQEAQERRFQTGALENPAWPKGATHWYSGYELEETYQAKAKEEKALLAALYQSDDPARTRAKLLHLKDIMLPGAPGQHADTQIDYLVALSYELEGNQPEAARRYLALAQQEPRSLWGSLAAARLQQK